MDTKIKERLEKYYSENVWEHTTLGEALELWSKQYGDDIAIIDGEKTFTYKQLNKEADCYLQGFVEEGVKKGDKVLLQLPNCVEFIIVIFTLFKIGAIPIMGLPAYRMKEIKSILEKSKAKYYIVKDRYLGFSYTDMIDELMYKYEYNLTIFVLGNQKKYQNLLDLRKNKTNNMGIKVDISYSDMALLLLSGGTTGIPKLIPRRHTDYLYVGKKCAQRCGIHKDTIYLATLPIAHNFPLGCPGIIGTLMCGGKVIICPTTSPDEIFTLIEEHKVTLIALVPAIANLCVDFLEQEAFEISSLELIQIGGSVLDCNMAKKIKEGFKCDLQQIFGMAEGLICCTSREDSEEVIYSTQGKPISEYDEVRIIDEYGKDVCIGEYGELIVRGPYTIYGYFNAEEVNKKSMTYDCYFKTGDRARKLSDGNYQIIGRVKDIINRAGEKISPLEIEEILLENKCISDVQVIGVLDDVLGEKIVVFLKKDDKKITLEELIKYLKEEGLASFKMPDALIYIEKWTLTSVGKIDRKQLKELATC